MPLFQDKYREETRRLAGHDYASPDEYFVTICTGGNREWFGEVKHRKLFLNTIKEPIRAGVIHLPKTRVTRNDCALIQIRCDKLESHEWCS